MNEALPSLDEEIWGATFDDAELSEVDGLEDNLYQNVINIKTPRSANPEEDDELALYAKADITDSLQLYMADIGRVPLLNGAKEEVELAKRIERGDMDAKRHMIAANQRLLVSVSKHYRNPYMEFQDIIQEANFGLIRAVEKFDWRKGFKFSTYATWWIRQAAARAVMNHGRNVRIPVNEQEKIKTVKQAAEYIRGELLLGQTREPTAEEIADLLDETVKDVKDWLALSRGETSLNERLGVDSDSDMEHQDLLVDGTKASQVEAHVLTSLETEELMEALKILRPDEASVLIHRFGVFGAEQKSLNGIGNLLNMDINTVLRTERTAFRKLREMDLKLEPTHQPPQNLIGAVALAKGSPSLNEQRQKWQEAKPILPALDGGLTIVEAQARWDAGQSAKFEKPVALGDMPSEYWTMANGLPRYGEEMLGGNF